MNAWHLLWIIPLAATCGLFVGCCCRAAGDADRKSSENNNE